MEQKKENYIKTTFRNIRKALHTLKRAIGFVATFDRKRFFILLGLAIVTALAPYLQNGLFSRLIDQTIAYTNTGTGLRIIFFSTVILIAATALPGVVSTIRGYIATKFRFKVIRELELYFYRKISSLDIATIEGTEYQELAQKANERGTGSIHHLVIVFIENITNVLGVIASFLILFFIDKQLLLYAVVGVLPILFVELRYGKDIYWIWDLNANNRRKYFNRRSHFLNTVSVVELKLYQLTNRFLGEIKGILSGFDGELEVAEGKKARWDFFALVWYMTFLGISIWRIVSLATGGELLIGQMLFAYTTYRGFNTALQEFFRKTAIINEYTNYAAYWFQINDLAPKIASQGNTALPSFFQTPPRIEFVNVSYRYDATSPLYAIKDLNLTFEAGQKIAIVGLSGAGKTTLIKLLCRVYDPESGYILINGINLKDIDLAKWQEMLGVLFQDFTSYNFTAQESIMVGNSAKPADPVKMLRAAKMAKVDGFIERLPKKYDQLLWKGFEDGVDLSKGERQRMALARVLYRESPITILDEPTASVDALAEQEIFTTLEKLPKDRTVILISHRFSTVKNTDKIFVIEHGKLIEEGSHLSLMELQGKYAELYKLQKDSYQ